MTIKNPIVILFKRLEALMNRLEDSSLKNDLIDCLSEVRFLYRLDSEIVGLVPTVVFNGYNDTNSKYFQLLSSKYLTRREVFDSTAEELKNAKFNL